MATEWLMPPSNRCTYIRVLHTTFASDADDFEPYAWFVREVRRHGYRWCIAKCDTRMEAEVIVRLLNTGELDLKKIWEEHKEPT